MFTIEDITCSVLLFLPPSDVLALAQASKGLHTFVMGCDDLWNDMVTRDFEDTHNVGGVERYMDLHDKGRRAILHFIEKVKGLHSIAQVRRQKIAWTSTANLFPKICDRHLSLIAKAREIYDEKMCVLVERREHGRLRVWCGVMGIVLICLKYFPAMRAAPLSHAAPRVGVVYALLAGLVLLRVVHEKRTNPRGTRVSVRVLCRLVRLVVVRSLAHTLSYLAMRSIALPIYTTTGPVLTYVYENMLYALFCFWASYNMPMYYAVAHFFGIPLYPNTPPSAKLTGRLLMGCAIAGAFVLFWEKMYETPIVFGTLATAALLPVLPLRIQQSLRAQTWVQWMAPLVGVAFSDSKPDEDDALLPVTRALPSRAAGRWQVQKSFVDSLVLNIVGAVLFERHGLLPMVLGRALSATLYTVCMCS